MAGKYIRLSVGDPAPWFYQACTSNERYAFDSVGGRYVVLCFFASAATDISRRVLDSVTMIHRHLFNDESIAFFGVSLDPEDKRQERVREMVPGIRYFWDFDSSVSRLYGAMPVDTDKSSPTVPVRCLWYVLDPTLRVINVVPFRENGSDIDEVISFLRALPPPALSSGVELQAPVLYLPHIFEPDLCRRLIALYEANGGQQSGFMRQIDGRTVEVHDYGHKRRADYIVTEQDFIDETNYHIQRRIVPEIRKAHQFKVTRIERHIVGCYTAEDGGHFRAHRDNTTKGTAHRRFAVSINLNSEFEGGMLNFPEYGPRLFKPPPGCAVVFSCSLLHMVTKVTAGRRYAFLPFLYDDEAARIRDENLRYVDVRES